jgi:acetyl-CoA synthetase
MTEDARHDTANIHPVAPRMLNGHKKPHIGPNVHAYKAAHAETIGQDSDKWWAAVCNHRLLSWIRTD